MESKCSPRVSTHRQSIPLSGYANKRIVSRFGPSGLLQATWFPYYFGLPVITLLHATAVQTTAVHTPM
ncbi:hypothetical protein VCR15J2_290111 [Vibrio coralliirubri]|nr:hypothetical protein VCR15J2_290111 [Vibrio coralliirubri]